MPDLAPWLPLLAIPFDAEVDADAGGVRARSGRQPRQAALGASTTFLERILMMPTLLVIEDGHWLDDASRFLLPTSSRSPRCGPGSCA